MSVPTEGAALVDTQELLMELQQRFSDFVAHVTPQELTKLIAQALIQFKETRCCVEALPGMWLIMAKMHYSATSNEKPDPVIVELANTLECFSEQLHLALMAEATIKVSTGIAQKFVAIRLSDTNLFSSVIVKKDGIHVRQRQDDPFTVLPANATLTFLDEQVIVSFSKVPKNIQKDNDESENGNIPDIVFSRIESPEA